MEAKTPLSGFNLFSLWFGAAVSVAEILTGGYLAELGALRGLWAILLGHLAGTLLLVLAGLIGYRERLPAIMSTRISFGRQGSYLISLINILQLVGWTAIMIIEGGRAMNVIGRSLWGLDQPLLMDGLIGLAVGLWVFWGVKGFKRINTLAALLLLALTVVMSWVVLTQPAAAADLARPQGGFGAGFELSIIMPLSWFPLIADYTSLARTRNGAVVAPFCGYFIGSCWMYFIGMAGSLFSGSPDPTQIMLTAHLGSIALAVLGLSTVTTTFLDVYSAGISLINVFPGLNDRAAAVGFTVIGTAIALVFPIERYTDFLYLLGSVFSPLIAILLTDYFLLKRDSRERRADPVATISLVAGIAFYYLLKSVELPIGATLATIAFTGAWHGLARRVIGAPTAPGGGRAEG